MLLHSARPLLAAALGLLVVASALRSPALSQVVQGGPAPVAPAAPAAGPLGATPAQPMIASDKAYRLRQGDVLLVSVYGEASLTPTAPVSVVPGGLITLPLIGDVKVSGLTTAEANLVVEQRYRKYVRDPKVTIAVYAVGPVEALILGNVRVPGKYTLPPPARITDIIAAAGGLGPTNGPLPDARVAQSSGATSSVSLEKLLRLGDTSQNIEVPSGATVYVPSPTSFEVTVSGAVDKPGDVTLNEGDDVALAIARAGASSNSDPDLNRVAVRRVNADGTATTKIVNLYPILKNGDLTNDVKMQKGDLVYVPKAAKHSSLLDFLYPLSALRPF